MKECELHIRFGPLFWSGPKGLGWTTVHAGVNSDLVIEVNGVDVYTDRFVTIVELLDLLDEWHAEGMIEDFVFDESIEGASPGPAFRRQTEGSWSVGAADPDEPGVEVSTLELEAALGSFKTELGIAFESLVGIDLEDWRRIRDPSSPDFVGE